MTQHNGTIGNQERKLMPCLEELCYGSVAVQHVMEIVTPFKYTIYTNMIKMLLQMVECSFEIPANKG